MSIKSLNSGIKLDHGIFKGFLLCLFSTVYLYPFIRVFWRFGDEGIFVYGAQLVAEGALPYRDFFEVAGPASFYWLGLFFRIFGENWLVTRGLILITATISIILIYWITRRLYRGPFDYIPAIFYMLISFHARPVTSHHWDSNLFGLLAIVMFFLWNHTRYKRYLIMAGIIAGLTSCFMQQKGLLLFFAFIIILIINGRLACEEKRKVMVDIGIMTIAFASVAILVLSLFYMVGGLNDLLYANLIFPLNNYMKINVMPYGYGIWEWLLPPIQKVLEVIGLPPFLSHGLGILILIPFFIIFALPLLLIVLAAKLYLNLTDRPKIFKSSMIICSSTGVALWISEVHRMDLIHLIYGSPVLVILLFALWNIYFEEKRVTYQLGLIIAIIPLTFLATFYLNIALAAKQEYVTRRGTVYTFQEDTALKFLHENIQAGSMVFIYPYRSMYYFLANIRNPTRYSFLLYNYNTEAQFNETITALERKRVKYVLLDTLLDETYLKKIFPKYVHPPDEKLVVEKYLQKHYRELEVRYGFRILERIEDLGD